MEVIQIRGIFVLPGFEEADEHVDRYSDRADPDAVAAVDAGIIGDVRYVILVLHHDGTGVWGDRKIFGINGRSGHGTADDEPVAVLEGDAEGSQDIADGCSDDGRDQPAAPGLVDDRDQLRDRASPGLKGRADGGDRFGGHERHAEVFRCLPGRHHPFQDILHDHRRQGGRVFGGNPFHLGADVAVSLNDFSRNGDDDSFHAGDLLQEGNPGFYLIQSRFDHELVGGDQKVGVSAVDHDRVDRHLGVFELLQQRRTGDTHQIIEGGFERRQLRLFRKSGVDLRRAAHADCHRGVSPAEVADMRSDREHRSADGGGYTGLAGLGKGQFLTAFHRVARFDAGRVLSVKWRCDQKGCRLRQGDGLWFRHLTGQQGILEAGLCKSEKRFSYHRSPFLV